MEIIPKPEQQEQPEKTQMNNDNNTLSPSSSGRNNGLLNSPEFEFWMVSNPSFPQPNLHSADELFVDGIILPLCLLSHDEQQQQHSSDENPQRNLDDVEEEEDNETPICLKPEPETELEPIREIGTQPGSGPESSSSAASTTVFSTSKRWRDIFKVGEKKSVNNNSSSNQEESKSGVEKPEKRKDRKSTGSNNTNNTNSTGTNNSAELNINIWPFSRSRSAGNNNVNRPKVPLTRKVSSAPCSRSNSGSESKSRKWPSSPSRGGGIHLGRSSPVWQVRRGLNTASTTSTTGMNKNSSEVVLKNADIKVSNVKKEGNADNKVKKEGSESSRWSKSRLGGGSGGGGSNGGGVVSGLNLNVQMCMGYRQNSICRSDEHRSSLLVNGASGGDQSCSGGAAGNNGGNGVKMFNIRTLFSSKKVY